MARFLTLAWVLLLAVELGSPRAVRAEEGPADASVLVGRWELFLVEKPLLQDLGAGIPKPHRCEHWFFPGGVWATAFAESNGSLRLLFGRWSTKGDALSLRTEDGKALRPVVWLPMAIVDEQLMRPAQPEPVLDPAWAWIAGEDLRWSSVSATTLRMSGPERFPYLQLTRRKDLKDEDLVGTWSGDGSSVTFREDGHYEREEDLGGRVSRLSGTWKLLGGVVRVELVGGVSRTLAPVLSDRLYLLDADDREGAIGRVALTRRAAGRPSDVAGPERPAPVGVVGVWVAPMEGGQAKITFRADGTFTREWPEGGKTRRFGGTFEVKGADLLVEDSEEPGTVLKVPFRRVGDDGLELTIEGETLRLAREGTSARADGPPAAPVPATLHGAWLAQDETGSVRLDLGADGSFVFALATPQQRWRYAGPCGVRGGVLEGRDEATGAPVRLPYRLADADTLVVTVAEVEFQLKRQGAKRAGGEEGGGGGTPPKDAAAGTALPSGALGTWAGSLSTVQGFDAGRVTLTLRPDQTYTLTWRLPGQVIPRTGTYKVEGNVLTFMAKGEGPISVEFRLGPSGLTLDAFAAMQPTTLTRQP